MLISLPREVKNGDFSVYCFIGLTEVQGGITTPRSTKTSINKIKPHQIAVFVR